MRPLRLPVTVLTAGIAMIVFAPGPAFAESEPSGTTAAHESEHAALGTHAQPERDVPARANDTHELPARNSSAPAATTSRSKRAARTDRDERSTAPAASEAVPSQTEASRSNSQTVARATKVPDRPKPPSPVKVTPRTTPPAEMRAV